MNYLLKETLLTSPVITEINFKEEISTEEVDSKEIDSMEGISEEIHFKVTPLEVIIIEEITGINRQDPIRIEVVTTGEETIFSIGVLILVENNHRLP